MFDIGFSEIVLILVVALIVLGPDKIPTVARTFGKIAGRAQRALADIKAEVERESRFEALQKLQQEIQQQNPSQNSD